MEITILCEATKFSCIPDLNTNSNNKFILTDKSLMILFCDDNGNTLTHSEISIEDAKKLAKLILTQ